MVVKSRGEKTKEALFMAEPSLAEQLLRRGGWSPLQQGTVLCAEMGSNLPCAPGGPAEVLLQELYVHGVNGKSPSLGA